LTCKIHVLCDGAGHPLHFELTAGQTHEAAAFDTVLIGADAALHDAQGDPMAWPVALAGDKGYRAQFAYPQELWVKRDAKGGSSNVVELANRYGVPCHGIENPLEAALRCQGGA